MHLPVKKVRTRLRTAAAGAAAALLLVALGAQGTAGAAPRDAPPSDGPRAELRGMIEDVPGSDAHRYQAKDSAGQGMDAAKVVQDGPGRYLAVYHSMRPDGRFHAFLSTSTDLMSWSLVHDFGPGASQPTISVLTNGGYVTAWEQDPDNHVAVRYYANRRDLFAGKAGRSFDAPQTLSDCAEGTPSIYSVSLHPDIDHSTIDIGGHFYSDCDVDRQMRATLTDFTSWAAAPQPNVDNALLHWGVRGNIGDRDALAFRGFPYGVFEGQYVKGDFGSWRTFLYDYSTGNADRTAIRTDGSSSAFANPTATALTAPDGRPAVFVGVFLPSEGAAPGEAGELLYYRTYAP